MTITYPRAMLGWIGRASFHLHHLVASQPEHGGRAVAVSLGPPVWRASFQTVLLTPARFGAARAWLDSLQGGARTFLGHDPARPFPLLHPQGFGGLSRAPSAGGGAFDGSALGWSLDLTRAVVTLTGLPAGLGLSAGDYVGWSWSGGRALARLLEGGAASGAGQIAVTVEPAVPLVVPPAAVATLAQPACLMRLAPGAGAPGEAEGPDGRGRLSFSAIQHLA